MVGGFIDSGEGFKRELYPGAEELRDRVVGHLELFAGETGVEEFIDELDNPKSRSRFGQDLLDLLPEASEIDEDPGTRYYSLRFGTERDRLHQLVLITASMGSIASSDNVSFREAIDIYVSPEYQIPPQPSREEQANITSNIIHAVEMSERPA